MQQASWQRKQGLARNTSIRPPASAISTPVARSPQWWRWAIAPHPPLCRCRGASWPMAPEVLALGDGGPCPKGDGPGGGAGGGDSGGQAHLGADSPSVIRSRSPALECASNPVPMLADCGWRPAPRPHERHPAVEMEALTAVQVGRSPSYDMVKSADPAMHDRPGGACWRSRGDAMAPGAPDAVWPPVPLKCRWRMDPGSRERSRPRRPAPWLRPPAHPGAAPTPLAGREQVPAGGRAPAGSRPSPCWRWRRCPGFRASIRMAMPIAELEAPAVGALVAAGGSIAPVPAFQRDELNRVNESADPRFCDVLRSPPRGRSASSPAPRFRPGPAGVAPRKLVSGWPSGRGEGSGAEALTLERGSWAATLDPRRR